MKLLLFQTVVCFMWV